jgi:hypothetical protein
LSYPSNASFLSKFSRNPPLLALSRSFVLGGLSQRLRSFDGVGAKTYQSHGTKKKPTALRLWVFILVVVAGFEPATSAL